MKKTTKDRNISEKCEKRESVNLPVMQYCQKMYFPCTFLTVDLCKRSESIVKSVRPCTLLTANFGKAKISLLYGTYRLPWRKLSFFTHTVPRRSRRGMLILHSLKLQPSGECTRNRTERRCTCPCIFFKRIAYLDKKGRNTCETCCNH